MHPHGHLTETVYMHQPPGFTDSAHSDYVLPSKTDSSLFIFHKGQDTTYLLLYVDDIILTASSTSFLQRIISLLHAEFAMTDLGPLNYFLVQQLYLYMHDPREPHLNAMKRVLRYLRGTTDLGLQLFCADAEYRGVANVVAETSWIRNLLRKLHTLLFTATLVYYDNVSAVYMSANPVQHQRTKQIEIHIHFVRDKVAAGHVRVLHVPSRFQYADIFTKGLPYPLFADFRSSLSVRKTLAPTTGAY
ncbi:ribonuclease H-like domain-containing protein [Tanacetum coccineum]